MVSFFGKQGRSVGQNHPPLRQISPLSSLCPQPFTDAFREYLATTLLSSLILPTWQLGTSLDHQCRGSQLLSFPTWPTFHGLPGGQFLLNEALSQTAEKAELLIVALALPLAPTHVSFASVLFSILPDFCFLSPSPPPLLPLLFRLPLSFSSLQAPLFQP